MSVFVTTSKTNKSSIGIKVGRPEAVPSPSNVCSSSLAREPEPLKYMRLKPSPLSEIDSKSAFLGGDQV